jgi:hypothetical protein
VSGKGGHAWWPARSRHRGILDLDVPASRRLGMVFRDKQSTVDEQIAEVRRALHVGRP